MLNGNINMRNIQLEDLSTRVKCIICKINGFYCETPQGADYNTCPLCEHYDFYQGSYIYDKKLHEKYFGLNIDDDEKEGMNVYTEYSFCEKCKIVFDVGCVHGCNGCTDDVYNGHFISKYKYKDIEYIGMPYFESIDEWFNEMPKIEILKWCCPNTIEKKTCSRPSYPISTHPHHYAICMVDLKRQNKHC